MCGHSIDAAIRSWEFGNMCTLRYALNRKALFSPHTENVTLLAAHTASEEGGRLVVSCSEEQVAIAWDCLTGDEIGRLESYEALTAVAWMRKGVIALGTI
jgi:hypothetical protein